MDYLSRQHLFYWLDGLKTEYEVFVPVKEGTNRFYQRYLEPNEDIVIGEVRTTEPLKGFFTPVREKVAEGFNPEVPPRQHKPFAIVGVKACDLMGFQVQDQVFLNNGSQNPQNLQDQQDLQDQQNLQNQSDPLYARARADNLIIGADCSLALETCFCLALDHKPYPESHFDINLSEVPDGFIVEVGSAKGQQVVDAHKTLFQQAIRSQGTPEKITIDKSGANKAAVESYNTEQQTTIEIRQSKYLNNLIEQAHRAVKRLTRPMPGFQSSWAAQSTLAGIEVMHMIRKDQLKRDGGADQTPAEQFYSLAA